MLRHHANHFVLGGGLSGLLVARVLSVIGFSPKIYSLHDRDESVAFASKDLRLLNVSNKNKEFLSQNLGVQLGDVFPIHSVLFFKNNDFLFEYKKDNPISWMVPYARLYEQLCPKGLNLTCESVSDREVEEFLLSEPHAYFWACDGKSSQARGWIGADVRLYKKRQMIVWGDLVLKNPCFSAYEYFLPQGVFTVLPRGAERASFVWHINEEVAVALGELNPSVLTDILSSLIKSPDIKEVCSPVRQQMFTPFCCDFFFKNNKVLVGDSAFALTPLAGQGLNVTMSSLMHLQKDLLLDRAVVQAWSGNYRRQALKMMHSIQAIDKFLSSNRFNGVMKEAVTLSSHLGFAQSCVESLFE